MHLSLVGVCIVSSFQGIYNKFIDVTLLDRSFFLLVDIYGKVFYDASITIHEKEGDSMKPQSAQRKTQCSQKESLLKDTTEYYSLCDLCGSFLTKII